MENQNPQVDLNIELENFQDQLIKTLDTLHLRLKKTEAPSRIYHYTNDAGLHGILESGMLRLSNVFSLNDPSELNHGFSHALKLLISETNNGSDAVKAFVEKFTTFLETGIEQSAYYFVCSFSSNEHDLGQWRSYADNGKGYALEFDANSLASGFADAEGATKEQRNSTFPLIYDDAEIIEIHRQFVKPLIPLISLPFEQACVGLSTQEYLKHLSIIFSIYALEAAMFFKHEAYRNEFEFRFHQTFSLNGEIPGLKWRARSNELVAYREFNWRSLKPQTLKRIIIGPAADKEKAERFIRSCLTAYNPEGKKDIEISYCAIPYRACS